MVQLRLQTEISAFHKPCLSHSRAYISLVSVVFSQISHHPGSPFQHWILWDVLSCTGKPIAQSPTRNSNANKRNLYQAVESTWLQLIAGLLVPLSLHNSPLHSCFFQVCWELQPIPSRPEAQAQNERWPLLLPPMRPSLMEQPKSPWWSQGSLGV